MRWRYKPAGGPHPASADPLYSPERKHRLDRIHQQTSLPLWSFEQLYLKPLRRYAALLERQPTRDATKPEGPLDTSLGLIESALMLRRSRLLPPGAAPEEQAQQTEAWSVALVYAVLLTELNAHTGTRRGSKNDYAQLVDWDILDWLQTFPKLWNQLTAVPSGQLPLAGALGELIDETHRKLKGRPEAWDRQSTEPHLTAVEPAKPSEKESQGLAFLNWLKNLIAQQQVLVNRPDATVHLIEGQALLCSPALFQRYCRDQKAAKGLEWRTIQQGFEALRIHRKRPDGRSIWTYELAWSGHPPRRLSGYLVETGSVFPAVDAKHPEPPDDRTRINV